MPPEIVLSSTFITWLTAIISISVGLIAKDLVTSFVSGLMFFFNRSFIAGDEVFIDGEKAIIVKVGIRTTVLVYRMDEDMFGGLYQMNALNF